MASYPSDSDSTNESIDLLATPSDSVATTSDRKLAATPVKSVEGSEVPAKKRPRLDDAEVSSSRKSETESDTVPEAIIPELISTPSNARWSVAENCLLVRCADTTAYKPRSKAAAFDLDQTLLLWRCAGWPSRPEHYEVWSATAIEKLRRLHDDEGYQLVIFSNQGGIRSAFQGKTAARAKGLIDWLAQTVDRPIHAVCSTSTKSGFHKPSPQMWEICEQKCNKKVKFEPDKSLYVGDSDGTKSDDNKDKYQEQGVDRQFAENVGKLRNAVMTFQHPEAFFGPSDSARRKAAFSLDIISNYIPPPRKALQIRAALLGGYLKGPICLILCGAQGSGKSFFCQQLLEGTPTKGGWVHLSQDTISNGKPGRREAVEKAAVEEISNKQSVVIDRMHLSPEQRSYFIEVAQRAAVPAHAILFNPPTSALMKRVKTRTDHPGGVQGERGVRLALSSLENTIPPKYDEGLELITTCITVESSQALCLCYKRVLSSECTPDTFPVPPLLECFGLKISKGDEMSTLPLPSIVLGTHKIGKKIAALTIKTAMKCGLAGVDTAPTYNNEEQIGDGLREAQKEKRDCFLIVKVPKRATQPAQVREELFASLQRLGRSTAELVLLHWPCDLIESGTLGTVWKELERIMAEGKCGSLGVSNFSVNALRALLPHCKDTRPIVNQVERHPLLPQWELLEYCKNQGISLQAHTSLGQGREELLKHSTIARIASQARGNKTTTAQVVLKWNLQHGVAVVAKCSSDAQLKDIAAVLTSGALSPIQMEELDAIGSEESKQCRFVAPPFMYKVGAQYSWGDQLPTKQNI